MANQTKHYQKLNLNGDEVVSSLFLASAKNELNVQNILADTQNDNWNSNTGNHSVSNDDKQNHHKYYFPETVFGNGDFDEFPSRGKFASLEISDVIDESMENSIKQEVPNMWSKEYIGLYSQYAAVGLLYGSNGTLLPFCAYTFHGETNVCANSKNIVTFAWSFKIFYAILVDSYRPFGLRRKPWMIIGWFVVLMLLLLLACTADQMSVTAWLVCLMLVQCFLMLSDVPADGYCVELGHLESNEQRGQILATGQRIRFTFCAIAGMIQAFLLNGPSTNDSNCPISLSQCWEFGFTINQYYLVLFLFIFFLTLPIIWLKELDSKNIPQHTINQFISNIWDTLQNLTTFYLLLFVIGEYAFTHFENNANISIQYYIIKLSNFQSGMNTVTTYAALVASIWIFQRYLINRNWRYTQYVSTFGCALLGLVWIAIYYDAGGTMNGWFTLFIDIDTQFVSGLIQVLYSIALIEVAKPGQEATTYELITTVGNAAITVNGIIATQLLTPLQSVGCNDDGGHCPSDTVVVTNQNSFNNSDGPHRFTMYTLVLTAIAIVGGLVFTPFLPASKKECHEWTRRGEALGNSKVRGVCSLLVATITILYGAIAAFLLLDVNTSCLPVVGGSGC